MNKKAIDKKITRLPHRNRLRAKTLIKEQRKLNSSKSKKKSDSELVNLHSLLNNNKLKSTTKPKPKSNKKYKPIIKSNKNKCSICLVA